MTESASRSSPPSKTGGGFGAKLQTGIGYTLGWLVVFPLFMGLVGGSLAWLFGFNFETWALAWGGVFFLIALFLAVARVGWTVFINLWPVLLVAAGIAFAVKKLFF